ncbi:MAG TPA: signal peptidase II [Candidatus Krumholzibacteria bacterium]|nr:signal peptidase II [Candidatus Krumholzibacteria bacterium]
MGLFIPALVIVLLDQATKRLFWRLGQNHEIIPGYFNITLVKNAGAAFGMFQGARVFFVTASFLAVGLIIYLGMRLPPSQRTRRILLGLILGGAIGNLIDRVASGEVIDFLQIGVAGHYWPVFNIADAGVTVGAALLILYALRSQRSFVPVAPTAAEEIPSTTADDSLPR